ncbi:response regulator receiver modulated CheW protein [Magnetococcus marinus MC-1]|uniref:Response regulator receiver modulated CheW protein n=1 Tax=Magnetococcus marinus (strain ATCC BAA-1437 / JCM 17883 / MC-1) TaxID=156889 RepID=A0L5A7_MAGMM|nr:chemotaxis protein [Magnetococcus marinus]ABK43150.1 response regulator receiver modulated CheW protein [Magnetococcus marinus MC-1]
MAELMEEVDQRANLALSNQMEMLTFFLSDEQLYGINVFKIIEVIETPSVITQVPGTPAAVVGTMRFREAAVTVLDLSLALGLPMQPRKGCITYIIVCEYSNTTQGLLINRPNALITRSWEQVKEPGSLSSATYLTATTYTDDGETIQILDVERVLEEVLKIKHRLSDDLVARTRSLDLKGRKVLIADDSSAARGLLEQAMQSLGLSYESFTNAREAFAELERDLEVHGQSSYALILSDIEMPGMDGFTFCRHVKEHESLGVIPLVLHSSMSSPSNLKLAKQVGANDFVGKFQPDGLAEVLLKHLGEAL